ncbi:MAG: hypothetical protein IIA59_06265 [Candidatus Marinimicrobia bacterium]|nr:hypothetical protein [Candidatus Neomarinimicrobiota bacterium]
MHKLEQDQNWRSTLSQLKVEFEHESDRACVIIASTMLDNALTRILVGYLCPSTSSDDELLDGPQAPLHSLASRIHISYRLGLISSRLARDLHLIRKIRNQFAHNIEGCSFEVPRKQDRIRDLARSTQILKSLGPARENYPPGARGEFELSVYHILFYLIFKAGDLQQMSYIEDEPLYDVSFWEAAWERLKKRDKSK